MLHLNLGGGLQMPALGYGTWNVSNFDASSFS